MAATPTAVARSARVSPSTLLALIHGTRWPSDDVQERIESAIGWPAGELVARAAALGSFREVTDAQLAAELARRLCTREARGR